MQPSKTLCPPEVIAADCELLLHDVLALVHRLSDCRDDFTIRERQKLAEVLLTHLSLFEIAKSSLRQHADSLHLPY